ncbi:MAG: hypothetical protein NPIRA01_15160 [Nitrospirales bacterium]|nr:MAG: hypothetical protein NPIRA01_15160 [Nitrospirales bacterium]
MMTNCFNAVPPAQRLMLCLVVIGFIWAGFYAMVWQPTTNEIEALHANVMYLEQEIERRKGHVSELDKKTSIDVSPEMMLGKVVSSNGQILRPRKDVMEITESFGLSLTFWMPDRRERGSENFEEQPLAMRGRVEGGYHRIAESLATILQLPWVVELNHIRLHVLREEGRGEPVLSADFQLQGLAPVPLQDSSQVIGNQL